MRVCVELAREAAQNGEVPVGAVLVAEGEILASAANGSIARCDPTAHAEVLALRRAATASGNYRLPGTTLYTSLEPCLMCVGAMLQSRIDKLVYGAAEPRGGAAEHFERMRHIHGVEVVAGILAPQCTDLMQAFFRQQRIGC